MIKEVPFVPNTEDDLHCLQAAYMIILKYFKPQYSIGWNEWSDLTGFEEDKGTWPTAGLVWFSEQGFDVRHIETFDFEAFTKNGETYLKERFPGSTGEWAIKHTNIAAEQSRATKLVILNVFENREPTINDIKKFIDEGYLVRAHVNARQLNNKPGYFGHAVVLFDHNHEGFTLHDPGLPPIPSRKVTYTEFEKAWFSPDDGTAEMDAIRFKQ